jgi:hypothetical protein
MYAAALQGGYTCLETISVHITNYMKFAAANANNFAEN